jgi:hypothetical protein
MDGDVEHYSNVHLNSAIGLHHAKGHACVRSAYSPCVSRRSMPSGIGSWRRRENSRKFVDSLSA